MGRVKWGELDGESLDGENLMERVREGELDGES